MSKKLQKPSFDGKNFGSPKQIIICSSIVDEYLEGKTLANKTNSLSKSHITLIQYSKIAEKLIENTTNS